MKKKKYPKQPKDTERKEKSKERRMHGWETGKATHARQGFASLGGGGGGDNQRAHSGS